MIDKKQIIKDFENFRFVAELKVLSKISLERPLTDYEFKRMMELKKELLE